ncbi:MAG: hypothetical protein M3N08_10290, partial [Pseudomonadota bacterium]|nr:hypothetical protein [Pseudomonadota bacterium]
AGQILNTMQDVTFRLGAKIFLFTTEHPMTLLDKKINADLAVFGFVLLLLALLFNTIAKLRGR